MYLFNVCFFNIYLFVCLLVRLYVPGVALEAENRSLVHFRRLPHNSRESLSGFGAFFCMRLHAPAFYSATIAMPFYGTV